MQWKSDRKGASEQKPDDWHDFTGQRRHKYLQHVKQGNTINQKEKIDNKK